MTIQTGKVKNGAIELPQELRTSWEDADIYISGEGDLLSIKRLSTPPLRTMLDEMNEAGKDIDQDDLEDAIDAARS